MRIIITAAAFLAIIGCQSEAVTPPLRPSDTSPTEGGGSKEDPVIARRGEDRVTLGELQAFLDGFDPARQAEVAPPEGRRAFLRNFLLYRAALRRAEAAGYGDDPRVRRARDRAMALHWTEDRVASYQSPPITDDEIRTRWERSAAEDRPARVRARHILLPDRATAEALRKDLLEQMAQGGADADALFAAAARKRSLDEKTRDRGGDLLFFSRGGGEVAWRLAPAHVLETALAMQNPGQLSLPLEGPDGVHLVMVTARRPAVQRSLEAATPELRTALTRERYDAAREALEGELLDIRDWTVDHRALDGLRVTPMGE